MHVASRNLRLIFRLPVLDFPSRLIGKAPELVLESLVCYFNHGIFIPPNEKNWFVLGSDTSSTFVAAQRLE